MSFFKVNLLVISAICLASLPAYSQKTKFVSMGTGGVTGVYYPVGGSIAKMVNNKKDQYKLRVSVESTGGSVFNINAVNTKELEFGIAQSDKLFHAFNGQHEWDKKAIKGLRTVFSTYPEAVTLVAAEDSKITSISTMKGKRINLGNHGSGQRANSMLILKYFGIDHEKDFKSEALKPAEGPKMLQDNRIDAFFYSVGHPNGAVTEATSGKRKVMFVPIVGPQIDKLLGEHGYYYETTIPQSVYPNAVGGDAKTIGMKAVLFTSSNVSEDAVYAVTKEVFSNFDDFKNLHPALNKLKKEDMVTKGGGVVPIHKGAMKYFREVGLVKEEKKKDAK